MRNNSGSKWAFSLFLALFSLMLFLGGCQNKNSQDQGKPNNHSKKQVSRFLDSVQKEQKLNGREQPSIGKGSKNPYDSNTIDIGYVNWTEGIAMTYLVEEIIEQKFGYSVNKRLGHIGEVLDSLAWGTNDFFLDHWLSADSTLGEMNDCVDLGINYRGAKMGLVVPEYMDIESINQLNDIKSKTDGKIVGIDAGSDLMQKTRKAIKTYGLDYHLTFSSGPAMTNRLQKAIEDKEPIVVTGWAPHWKFSRFNLKFLKDPEYVYGISKNIHTLARKGLQKDHPKVAKFLKRFSMNKQQMGNLIRTFAANDDWDQASEKWVKEHEELVNQWLKGLKEN